jgi:predicted tellurium resistance membrane protein TerC
LHKIFRYLHYGLAVILVFIGVKMLISDWYKIPVWLALLTVGLILCVSVVASWFSSPKTTEAANQTKGRIQKPKYMKKAKKDAVRMERNTKKR